MFPWQLLSAILYYCSTQFFIKKHVCGKWNKVTKLYQTHTQKINKTAFTNLQVYIKHFYNYTLNKVHTEIIFFLDTIKCNPSKYRKIFHFPLFIIHHTFIIIFYVKYSWCSIQLTTVKFNFKIKQIMNIRQVFITIFKSSQCLYFTIIINM